MEKSYWDAPDSGMEINETMVERYLESLSVKGKSKGTIQTYRRYLSRLCQYQSEDKKIYLGTLNRIRKDMLAEGYAASTVNSFTASANGFFEFYGCRNYQVFDTLKCENDVQPELTREEYLRLLSAARLHRRERTYLLIKLIASTGIMLSQLPEVTVEAVHEGELNLSDNLIHIPSVLCCELLDYADKHSINRSQIFVTRTGHEIDRSNINREFRSLARDARVLEEKCTPMSLRRMYQTAQQDMQSKIKALINRSGDRLMEQEQHVYGWDQLDLDGIIYNQNQMG